jgi:hypothetical protein
MLGLLDQEAGMFFRRKPGWRRVLRQCDHDVAASGLMHYLADHAPSDALGAALEAYFTNPSYTNALAVVSAEPETIMVFRESRPGGTLFRLAHPVSVR